MMIGMYGEMLRREMAKDNDSRLVSADKNRPDKEFEMVQPGGVTERRLASCPDIQAG